MTDLSQQVLWSQQALWPLQRIVLTGYMCSGKTTVGRLLAHRLRWTFVDLDHAIEQATGRTVPQIFAGSGEPAFRELESHTLATLLLQSKAVIALGGGAPEAPVVRHALAVARETAVIHLHAPFAVLYARCTLQAQDPDATARPLLTEAEAAEARYDRRRPLYSSIAHHTVDAAPQDPCSVADAICRQLHVPADF